MNIGGRLGAIAGAVVREQISRDPWRDIGSAIGQQVRQVVEVLEPEVFEIWRTANDEHTCPICGRLNGTTWPSGLGVYPPVHDHCRCERAYHHTIFRRRIVTR